MKNMCVDLPLSQDYFAAHFPVQYNYEHSVKKDVSVCQLEPIFGKNWHSFHFEKSSTTRRIIGLVHIHFRKKFARKHQYYRNR